MLRSIRQLEAIRDEWDGVAAAFRTPLLEHDWFLSCAEAFHRESDLRVITVSERQSLTGAVPLVREASPGGSRLMLLGESRLYEPSGWVFASPGALGELAERVIGLGEPMVMQRLDADSPICGVLAALSPRRAITAVRGLTTSLTVVMRGTWDSYYAALSSHVTGNLPRLRRKAEREIGAMRFERVSPAPGDVDTLLDTFVRVEGSGWKGQRGSALAARTELRAFFRAYCRRAAGRGRLRVTTLSFGSNVAAMEIAVEAYNRLWQLKIGYNDALARFYPGLHLTRHSIEAAFEGRLDAYEFLGSAAPWEQRWAPDERRYRLLAVYPTTAAGVITGCRDIAGAVWRRACGSVLQRQGHGQ